MSLLAASQALSARTIGGSGQSSAGHDESLDPGDMAEPVLSIPNDLGSIEHLFRTPSLSNLTANVLPHATDSFRGPHGGLIPSSLQHAAAAGVTRVDGQALLEASTASSAASSVVASVLGRVKSLVGG